MAGIFDEDLTTPEAPPPKREFPAGGAAPLKAYPGMFSEDLTTPEVVAKPPPPPDTRPWYVKGVETADDAARAFANTVTFGGADRLAGYMGSGGPQTLSGLVTGQKPLTYEDAVNAEVARSEAARKRSPYASTAADLTAGVAMPGLGAEALAARFGNTALNTARQAAAARAAAYGVTGAGLGVAQGAGNTYTGNPWDYAQNALMGGVLGGVLGGAVGGAVGTRPAISAAKTPTTAETYAARDFAYGKLGQNQGFYENPYLATRADQLARDLSTYNPTDIPSSLRAVEQMRASTAIPGGGNTPAEIERIRQGINKIPFTPERAADRSAGREVKQAIDEFYANPPLGAVRAGTEAEAAAAGETADLARKLHGAARRGHTWDNLVHDAELASQNPRSGVSFPDAVWAGVRNLEKSDRPGAMPKLAGYSDAEKAALEKIGYPGFGQRFLRGTSDVLGGGTHGIVNPFTLAAGGAGTGYGLGYALGAEDPTSLAMLGAAGPLTGLGARIASNRMANKAIREAGDIIHQSNPLYDYRVMTSGTKSGGGLPPSINDPVRNAITTAIVRQSLPRVIVDQPSSTYDPALENR